MDPQKAITIGEGIEKCIEIYCLFSRGCINVLWCFCKDTSALASVGGFAVGLGAQSLIKGFNKWIFYFVWRSIWGWGSCYYMKFYWYSWKL